MRFKSSPKCALGRPVNQERLPDEPQCQSGTPAWQTSKSHRGSKDATASCSKQVDQHHLQAKAFPVLQAPQNASIHTQNPHTPAGTQNTAARQQGVQKSTLHGTPYQLREPCGTEHRCQLNIKEVKMNVLCKILQGVKRLESFAFTSIYVSPTSMRKR